MSFGGLFRRIEQSVLQSVGAVESSISNAEYTEDDTRLDRVDATLKALSDQQQSYQQASRRSSETALHYGITLERTLTALSSASTAPHQLDLKPLLRVLAAQKNAVSQVNDQCLGMGMRRVAALMKEAGGLRVEFTARREKVTDYDSYLRRCTQAEQALAATTETVKKVEARETLRKAEGKVKDSAAVVAQMSSRIRARLGSLEVSVTAEATECALALLALQCHAGVHVAESSTALLPTYPGAAHYMCELAAATAEKAQGLILSMGGGGKKGPSTPLPTSPPPSLSAHDTLYATMAAALRSPYTVEGASGAALIDAAPFAVLHAGASSPSSKLSPPSATSAPIDFRPPGNAPGPAAAAAAPALRLAAAAGTSAGGGTASGGGGAAATPSANTLVGDEGEKSSWVRVLFNYTPSQSDELALAEGSKVYVLEWAAGGDENWVRGRSAKGEEGVFPSNYVKCLTLGEVRACGLPLSLPNNSAPVAPSVPPPTASSSVFETGVEGGVEALIDFTPIAPSNPTPPPPAASTPAAAAAALAAEVTQPPPPTAVAVESSQSQSPTFEGGAFDFN